ncbi:MFS transporter [Defluviimonas aestuarii]|uniref:MFS transporter n=1 Tax=Albidovulum aestuarii TaxID=1130726 RepID=UPI00249A2913|nr:MFS transporter [Defluviimonas aestuarii]
MTMADRVEGTAWRDLLRRDTAASLALVCLGVWLHAADSLIVATMMPAIVAGIGGDHLVAWNFALYETGSIVIGAASGLIAIRHGLRRPMTIAALAFGLGCMVSALAPAMQIMLAGRVLQGLGGGGLTALAFVSARRLFPARLIPRVMASMSLVWGTSAFLGPLFGGLFVTYANWRAGFAVFGLQALLLAFWIWFGLAPADSPATDEKATDRIPFRRLGLLSLAVLSVTYAGITATPGGMAAALLAGLAALALFARLDSHSAGDRLLPRRAFDPRDPVGAALVMVLAVSIATMGLATYGPLLMDLIHKTPPLIAGYVVATISIAWTVGAVLSAGLAERHDPKIIAVGMCLIVLSVVGLLYAVPRGPVGLIAVFAACEGLGFGLSWTFILRRGTRLVRAEDADRFSAGLPTLSRLGYAFGASAVGILANSAGFSAGAGPDEAAHVARVIFAGSLPFAGIALFAMLRFVTARR